MYVLMGKDSCRGVYDSKRKLREAVDYWMAEFPEDTLSYEEWDTNYILEPSSWGWCYIAPTSSIEELGKGGGHVPIMKFWGKNLAGVEWTYYDDEDTV